MNLTKLGHDCLTADLNTTRMLELKGSLSLYAGNRSLGSADRIELLAQIAETGSISAAARAVGMSYKGAWDAVDAMNNLADEPLVVRTSGGKHGGGTQLTARGQRLVETFRAIEVEHQRFLRQLSPLSEMTAKDIELMGRFMLKTSARNQLSGKVVAVKSGAVNDTVELETSGGQRVVSVLTSESTRNLGLVLGKEAVALFKASSVLVGLPRTDLQLSAQNQWPGKISRIIRGAVNSEVSITLEGGNVIVAVITNVSSDALLLGEDVEVVAITKASSIILGTLDLGLG